MARRNWVGLVKSFVFGIIGTTVALTLYMVSSIAITFKDQVKQRLEDRHITVSRQGARIRVKEWKDEDYKDKTQRVLVNIWNHASFPAYKGPFHAMMTGKYANELSDEDEQITNVTDSDELLKISEN